MKVTAFLIALACTFATAAFAQTPEARGSADNVTVSAVNSAMNSRPSEIAARHLKMTAHRTATAADTARAARIVASLRGAIGKYRDYHIALDEGYRIFLPDVPQKIYHFTNYSRAIQAAMSFDPSEPTSLLYRKTASGYELAGAMYTAPASFSESELDARVPLGIASWHEHVNLCLPKKSDTARWRETRAGVPLFGPEGSIATQDECDAAGGRFVPRLFGWMVHVNPLTSDPALVWGAHEHGDGEMNGMHHQPR
jgi:hypothetical protein